ncbi:glutathione S-transferase [Rhodoferax lacus]|uniref:Glutathione S-transferase n=1 Tax=Rhodoferax lacus TaxID=2184758 RepID=A0A3E1RHV9_9BURK|nr:glutathione S-transferase [Rhodoferax lacus]RFO98959.1 glutathione S-transferase [Rhodoferax lacus]
MRAPVLYSFRRCPYAMRARLALQASGLEVELREILLKDKPPALLQASPKGTVPVLVLPDGPVLEQSLEIMHWALQQHDPLKWLPTDDVAIDDTLACIATNDGPFKQALDRYKYPTRFGLVDGQAPRAEGCKVLQAWELRLQRQAFLGGSQWGLVDAAIAPFVRQFAHTDLPWFAAQDWPRLRQWLQAFEDSAAFAAVMQKEAVWTAGDAPRLTRFAPPAAP